MPSCFWVQQLNVKGFVLGFIWHFIHRKSTLMSHYCYWQILFMLYWRGESFYTGKPSVFVETLRQRVNMSHSRHLTSMQNCLSVCFSSHPVRTSGRLGDWHVVCLAHGQYKREHHKMLSTAASKSCCLLSSEL